MNPEQVPRRSPEPNPPPVCHSIEWYAEGQSRVVEVDGVQVTVRLVARQGRRARIAITAPAGAEFRSLDSRADTKPGDSPTTG